MWLVCWENPSNSCCPWQRITLQQPDRSEVSIVYQKNLCLRNRGETLSRLDCFCFVLFFYEKHVQVKQHLGWKVVSLHSSKWRHPPPSRKITVHLTEDSTTRLQMEKQAPGQLGLMMQTNGFKWILEEMSELQSSLLKGVKTTISGWRHLLSHTVLMATLLFRFTRRMGLKRSGEVHFAWWTFQLNIISKIFEH